MSGRHCCQPIAIAHTGGRTGGHGHLDATQEAGLGAVKVGLEQAGGLRLRDGASRLVGRVGALEVVVAWRGGSSSNVNRWKNQYEPRERTS